MVSNGERCAKHLVIECPQRSRARKFDHCSYPARLLQNGRLSQYTTLPSCRAGLITSAWLSLKRSTSLGTGYHNRINRSADTVQYCHRRAIRPGVLALLLDYKQVNIALAITCRLGRQILKRMTFSGWATSTMRRMISFNIDWSSIDPFSCLFCPGEPAFHAPAIRDFGSTLSERPPVRACARAGTGQAPHLSFHCKKR